MLGTLTQNCLTDVEKNLDQLAREEAIGYRDPKCVVQLELGYLLLCVLSRSIAERADLKY